MIYGKYYVYIFLFNVLYFLNIKSYSFKANTNIKTNIFNNWNCIGIINNIDFSKPYPINIGELPLVIWKNPNKHQFSASINICKHMGSKLDNGEITKNGCLKCKYHGLENTYEDRIGETIEHEGKLFWSYKPSFIKPHSLPFYNNIEFQKSFLEIDMECSLKDSAFNSMDLRHPEYVHSGLFGFGNDIPPKNIKHYIYSDKKVGLAFDYISKQNIQKLNSNSQFTSNFHMYEYPTFTWSKVTFDRNKHLIIGVNFLPIEEKKTRWYVTICNNYFTNNIQKDFLKMLAYIILKQDLKQMKNQHKEDALKSEMLFSHIFEDEDIMLWLKEMFDHYEYPTILNCVELYKDYIVKK
jgi:phenylpropionate dioxygenase-like ring-hydroxylating dioxygenase large terminal subunit